MKNKMISKVFTTTLIMFIVLTVYTIPVSNKNNKNVLRTNLEISDITNIPTNKIYLLSKDKLLVQAEVFINGKEEEKIKNIINYLTITNNNTPIGLDSYIPENTKILNITKEKNEILIDFSKEILESSEDRDLIITGIVYSLLEIEDISKVSLKIEGEPIKGYEDELDKKIGINNKYLYENRNNISKVVVYYMNNISNDLYFVPVTKYLNDERDKIEIIIDELKNTSNDMISYLDEKTKLLDYKEESNVLYLNFNDYLLNQDEATNEIIKKSVAYSVFDNYDVNIVMFEVNGKQIDYIKN